LKLLTFTRSYQIKYNIILCIWILSFEQQIYDNFDTILLEFIPLSTELVKDISKEKIIRLIVAIWKNFLLFSFEKSVPMFVGTRALESVTILMDRKLIDEELHADLESIFEILNRVYQSLKYYNQFIFFLYLFLVHLMNMYHK
jgi:V-type H+-transporting ATPase subunit H